MTLPMLFDRRLLFRPRAVGSEAGPGDNHHSSIVGQAIQACRGQQRITEQVGALFWRAVAGEEDPPAFVALVDDVVEILRSRGMEGLEPEVIQHQQVGAEIGLEAALEGVVGGQSPPRQIQQFLGNTDSVIV